MSVAKKPMIDDSIVGDPATAAPTTPQGSAQDSGKRATLNLTITSDERWEIKEWSTRHRMKIVDVMREGFQLMKQKYGE